MLKRIIGQDTQDVPPAIHHWLKVDGLAQVEVTSEDAAHPIESGLLPGLNRVGELRNRDRRPCALCLTSR
jgi:hypothetical protein